MSKTLVAAGVCSFSGCGGGAASVDSGVAPTVTATSPDDLATGVEPSATVSATFSQDMAADTLDTSTFVVTRDGAVVAGTVRYAASTRVATFEPAGRLGLLGAYAATVTTGATDADGAPLAADTSWSFVVRDGQWGTAELLQADDTNLALNPRVAFDAAGNAAAVWQQSDGTRYSIWTSRFVPGTGWGTAELLEADDAGHAYAPAVAFDPAGDATAVWQQSDGARYSIWASRFVPGTGWGAPALVETSDAGDAGDPRVVVDGAGNATAVWTQSNGARVSVWANRFVPGTGWGAATLLESDDAGDAGFPTLAVDPVGNVTAVWHQASGTYSIWANRFRAGSGWGLAAPIETGDAGNALFPTVAVDAAGDATAVWHQSDGTHSSIWSNRFVPGVGWGTAELVESDDAGDAFTAQVAVSPAGEATAVWQQSDGTWDNAWANRFTPGAGWGTPTLLETDDTNNVGAPTVGVDTAGNVTVVWFGGSNMWADRFVPATGWGVAAIMSSAPSDLPQLAVDPAGSAIAVWSGGSVLASTFQ